MPGEESRAGKNTWQPQRSWIEPALPRRFELR